MDGINNTPSQTPGQAPQSLRPTNPAPTSPNLMNQNFQGGAPKSSMGPIIGSIVVILAIVLGGLYLYGQQLGKKATTAEESTSTTDEVSAADQATLSLEGQGSTDSTAEIENDLNATELNNLDAEMQNVDQDLTY